MKSPRGIIFSVLGGLLFLLWFGPTLLTVLFSPPGTMNPDLVMLLAPPMLFLVCLINILSRFGRGALYFTPAEVDFLFPAPVTRVNLLIYKLLGMLAASLGLGLFVGVFVARMGSSPVTAIIATFLAVLFINLSSVMIALIKENVVQGGSFATRAFTLLVAAAIVAMLALPIWTRTPDLEFTEAVREVLNAPTVAAVLSPFRIFAATLIADQPVRFAWWASVSLAMNVVVFAAIVRLDALNLETAVQTSRKQHERLEAARSQKLTIWKGAARWRIPALPFFGGAGGMMWRQLTTALRSSRTIVTYLVVIGALFAAVHVLTRNTEDLPLLRVLIGPALFFTFMLISMVRFDFRGDLDQLEWLKMLPVRERTLVMGELFTPIVVLTLVQACILAMFALLVDKVQVVLIAAAFLLPVNIVLVGLENILFLLYPTRHVAAGLGDLQALGRNMVLFFVRGLVLVTWAGIGALLGFFVYFATASLVAAGAACWITLMLASLGVVPATAHAFRRFDVSVHMPA